MSLTFVLLADQLAEGAQLFRRQYLPHFEFSLRAQLKDRRLRRSRFAHALVDQILIRILGVDGLIECASRLAQAHLRRH